MIILLLLFISYKHIIKQLYVFNELAKDVYIVDGGAGIKL